MFIRQSCEGRISSMYIKRLIEQVCSLQCDPGMPKFCLKLFIRYFQLHVNFVKIGAPRGIRNSVEVYPTPREYVVSMVRVCESGDLGVATF